MPERIAVLVVVGLSPVNPAWAGGTASLTTWDGRGEATTARVEFEGQRMRVDSSALPGGYLLLRGSDAKMVMPVGASAAVVDLAAVMKTLGPRAQRFADGTDGVREFVSLTDTGKHEAVAGIPGSLYHLIYVDNAGQKMRAEIVLSRDARAVEFTRGFRRLLALTQQAAGVAMPTGSARLEQTLEARQLGVLRYADRMLVTQLDSKAPAEARFALPASPLTLPDLSGWKAILGGR